MRVDEILTSPLVRTRQTAELLAAAFARPPKVTDLASLAVGGRPSAVIADLARFSKRRHLALVGHAPGIGDVAARLLGARHGLDFKKGAVCGIEVDALPPTRAGTLLWFATPRMLRSMGRAG
jgi:phosphohistidine phosphatase